MYSVMRYYPGQSELGAEVKKHSQEVEKVISSVPGFVAYFFIHNPDGITAVTICETRKGCDESNRVAAEWLQKNLPHLKAVPKVVTGEVTLSFDRIHTMV